MTDARRPLLWEGACGLLLVLATLSRLHNASAYPPLHDFDGPGHALNVLALHRGELPDPRAWLGFHPPLYHALGALVWWASPEWLPVHSSLRGLSTLFVLGTTALVWWSLRGPFGRVPAAVASCTLGCAPGVAIGASMLGNESLCALLCTLVLVRLGAPPPRSGQLRHAALTGLLAGAAALAKSTGLVVAGVAVLFTALPRQRTRATTRSTFERLRVGPALCTAAVAGAMVLPHLLRVLDAAGGSPLAVISGAALSPELAAEMASQPPGERRIADYLRLPLATWLAPHVAAPGLERSVPGLLYASLWADAHGQFLPAAEPGVLRAEAGVALAGLVPTGLALLGAAALAGDRSRRRALAPALWTGALLVAALCRYVWVVPTYSAVKASYLLPGLLPATALLAAGVLRMPPRARPVTQAMLLTVAALSTALTTWGWWVW